MTNFLLVLLLIGQIVNLVLLVAFMNYFVRLVENASKARSRKSLNEGQGLIDLPTVPDYSQQQPPKTEGLVLVKDQ